MDEQALRLPAVIDAYPDASLNHDLYLWLSALAAHAFGSTHPWIVASQQATLSVLQSFPGLEACYKRLADAEIAHRPNPDSLRSDEAAQEAAIRRALRHPGTVHALPQAKRVWHPVRIWLHPNPPRLCEADHSKVDMTPAPMKVPQSEGDGKRRLANPVEERQRRAGFFLPRPETIFTWTQYFDLDGQTQDDEGLPPASADDMDVLAVSRHGQAPAKRLRMDLEPVATGNDDGLALGEILLPEWDYRKRILRDGHCALREYAAAEAAGPAEFPAHLRQVRKHLHAHLSSATPYPLRLRAQPDGPEIDLDPYLRFLADGHSNNRFYRDERPRNRDLACLLLADLSLSTDAAVDNERQVIDVIRDSLILFAETLAMTSDRFAVYGFSSRTRMDVRFHPLKTFDEPYSPRVRARILGISPGYYTRMGAAIRAATRVLSQERMRDRLLLLLTDGKPNDADIYDGRFGIEDTRHAFIDARRQGLRPFCITIDQYAHDYLPHIFGRHNFVIIRKAAELPARLTLLYAHLSRQ
ncbi:MAG: VWA domain-containing protein [Betaproteobacteria bacterium]|nr:VWA domain-containing protein [Betaproteobacteria bacterium]